MDSRSERIRAEVLNFIADDYEEIGQIMIDLSRWSSGLCIGRDEVRSALTSLIQDGLAKAYRLGEGRHVEGVPEQATFDEHYFYITPKGIEMLPTFPEEWFTPLAGED